MKQIVLQRAWINLDGFLHTQIIRAILPVSGLTMARMQIFMRRVDPSWWSCSYSLSCLHFGWYLSPWPSPWFVLPVIIPVTPATSDMCVHSSGPQASLACCSLISLCCCYVSCSSPAVVFAQHLLGTAWFFYLLCARKSVHLVKTA